MAGSCPKVGGSPHPHRHPWENVLKKGVSGKSSKCKHFRWLKGKIVVRSSQPGAGSEGRGPDPRVAAGGFWGAGATCPPRRCQLFFPPEPRAHPDTAPKIGDTSRWGLQEALGTIPRGTTAGTPRMETQGFLAAPGLSGCHESASIPSSSPHGKT